MWGLVQLGGHLKDATRMAVPHSCCPPKPSCQPLWKTITYEYAIIFVLTLLIHQGRIEILL